MSTRQSRRFAAVVAAGVALVLAFGERAHAGAPPIVTAPSLHADGEVDALFTSETFTATGTGTVTWSDDSNLPSDMSLAPSGLYLGTPHTAGVYNFLVTANDDTLLPATISRGHHIAEVGQTL